MDQISMAFLVLLQRLTPAERAVLLLRDVFDFDYKEIAALVGKNEPACRKLLERAREHVANEKRLFTASPEAHRRLLMAFTKAARAGDVEGLVNLLAEDAVMITDGGPEGRRVDGRRSLPVPLKGGAKIAAFVAASSRRGGHYPIAIHELNGQPAVVFYDDGEKVPSARCYSRSRRPHPSGLLPRRLDRLGHLGAGQEVNPQSASSKDN